MTDAIEVPPNVVRFYGSLEYALDTIGAKQITLIHTSLLNDPFDPYLFFETDFADNFEAMVDHVSNKYPADFGWFIHAVPTERWQNSINDLKQYFATLRDQTYVFSTVGVGVVGHPKDNLYLWSHYGHGHRGVAIEFDTNEIALHYIEMYNNCHEEKINAGNTWVEVEYQDK